jgi:nitrate reductase NapE
MKDFPCVTMLLVRSDISCNGAGPARSVRLQMTRLTGTARERATGSTMSDSEVAGRYMSDTSGRHDAPPLHGAAPAIGRRAEFFVFAVIAAFIWPVVAVGVVGGYGFLVWMSQMILGPPGPPGG